jgi:hypothetical protein
MTKVDLDRIDAAVALIEGPDVAALDQEGRAVRPDMTPYKPTRERGEAMRLMDKHITRMAKLSGGWAAIGLNGRAYVGPTSLIAICAAISGTAEDSDGLSISRHRV